MDNKEIIQNFISNYKEGFDPYTLTPSSSYEFKTLSVVLKNGEIVRKENSRDDNYFINLASCSKPFLIKLLAKVLEEKGIDHKEKIFIATKDLVKEIFFRQQQKHLLENPDYLVILRWIGDFGNIHWDNDNFPETKIDFKEICYNVLKLSSNRGLEIARDKLEELLGSDLEIQKYLEQSGIAPTLELHRGGNKLWKQPRANVADLLESTKSFDILAKDLFQNTNENYSADMFEAMHNNKVHFDVGLSSKIAGYEILEKTGMMWPICWGSEYSEMGYPPHMVLGDVASIIVGDNRYTFMHFKAVSIAIPKSLDETGFPNLFEKNYSKYIFVIKRMYLRKFWTEMESLLGEFLPKEVVVKVIDASKDSLGDRLKETIYKLILSTLR